MTPRPAPLIKLDYFDMLAYANLWEGRCHCLDGLGHAPFWEAPSVFTIRRCGRQVVVLGLRPFDTKLDAPDSKSNPYVDSLNLEETKQLKWSAVAHSHS